MDEVNMLRPQVANFQTDRQATERPPFPDNIGSCLDAAAERFAGRTLWRSIEGDPEELTFREFQLQTLKCADGFRSIGVGPGTHVALMMPNVPAFLVAWVALARLGAVAVTINTA